MVGSNEAGGGFFCSGGGAAGGGSGNAGCVMTCTVIAALGTPAELTANSIQ